jgi:hypothetical protein
MNSAFLYAVVLMAAAGSETAPPQQHPFVDDEMAVYFGEEALRQGYVHHEYQRCLTSSVKFSIKIELPLPQQASDRKYSVTSHDCAKDRKALIEKLLVRFPTSAFKTVNRKTEFKFDLTARYSSE